MAAGQGGFDQMVDSFVDFSDYDTNNLAFQSPELTPSSSSNLSPPNTLKTEPPSTPSLFPTSQVFAGPSHQYDLHKQQTGIVPGALATTLSMNPPHGFYQEYLDFQEQQVLAGMDDELFDFNSPLQGTLDASALDLGFQTPPSDSGLYLNTTINPNALGGHEPDALSASSMPPPPSSLTTNGGRLYPGMHQQQAALARAQFQQKQQLLQRQRAQQAQAQQAKQAAQQKTRAPQTSGTIAEQSVQNILNSMRTEVPHYEPIKTLPPMNFPKQKKAESEMDEDEKFLASAEGKKLDPQARRQLRNKVSARAFRGRRKGKPTPSPSPFHFHRLITNPPLNRIHHLARSAPHRPHQRRGHHEGAKRRAHRRELAPDKPHPHAPDLPAVQGDARRPQRQPRQARAAADVVGALWPRRRPAPPHHAAHDGRGEVPASASAVSAELLCRVGG